MRWALSPSEGEVHVLSGERPRGALKGRCGAILPMVAIQHDQRPLATVRSLPSALPSGLQRP
jgi:hypothetical protein